MTRALRDHGPWRAFVVPFGLVAVWAILAALGRGNPHLLVPPYALVSAARPARIASRDKSAPGGYCLSRARAHRGAPSRLRPREDFMLKYIGIILALMPFRLGHQKYMDLLLGSPNQAQVDNFMRVERWIFPALLFMAMT